MIRDGGDDGDSDGGIVVVSISFMVVEGMVAVMEISSVV